MKQWHIRTNRFIDAQLTHGPILYFVSFNSNINQVTVDQSYGHHLNNLLIYIYA